MTRASIKDVARKAGVSTATVSHVLNGTRFVSQETQQKVFAAIEELNYQPNIIARSLITSTTQTVGLVISDIRNPFFTAIARGVEDEISQDYYHSLICNTDEDPAREDEYLRLLFARQIDGLIIAPSGNYSERLVQMAQAGIPIVLIDRAAPGLDAPLIQVDNEGGAYQAVCYLSELGHRRIAALTGPVTISTMKARIDGYRRALHESGLPFDKQLIFYTSPKFHTHQNNFDHTDPDSFTGNQTVPSSYDALQKFLALPQPPTAIFVANNQMALGMLHALNEKNLACPADISLVTFDDHDWAPLLAPPLTVVRQPTYQLGRIAARTLLQLINHQTVEPLVSLPVELIIRKSCQPFQG